MRNHINMSVALAIYEVNYLSLILCSEPKSTADSKTLIILLAKAWKSFEFFTLVTKPSRIETITNEHRGTKRRNCGGAPLSFAWKESKRRCLVHVKNVIES